MGKLSCHRTTCRKSGTRSFADCGGQKKGCGMMKSRTRRLLMLSMLVCAVLCLTAPSAFAARTEKLRTLSEENYVVAYALKNSGKIYPYTDSTLKTRESTTRWIDCAKDECRIVDFADKALKISYPLDSGKRAVGWFPMDMFTSTNVANAMNYKTVTAKLKAYKRSDGKDKLGNTAAGTNIYILRKSGSYTQIIYPLDKGNWKMGWVLTSNLNANIKEAPASKFDPIWPCATDYTVTCLYYYNSIHGDAGYSHSCRYDRYTGARFGIDISGGNGNDKILAVEAGTVVSSGNTGSGFGNCITIKHKDGTISLYAHLSKRKVSKGDKVKKGEEIGTMGSTGGDYGNHLHFELSNTDPWKTYYKDKYGRKMSYEQNVRSNNARRNDDKSIVEWIDDNCRKSGVIYYPV